MFTNSLDKHHTIERAKNIISDAVTISSADKEGWSIIFDKDPRVRVSSFRVI